MSFLQPLGLLGLIGIPVLIVIYIIKNKYTEVVVPSTYIWNLSEKFLKKRNPINKLVGLISLILQILVVLFVSVAIANPVFVIPHSAESYCFILDGSGSMYVTQNDKTRFELGKEKIGSIINTSVDGCDYTLICVGTSTEILCEKECEKRQVLKLLDSCNSSYCTTDYIYALGAAQEYFNDNPSVKTYLVTDKDYTDSRNVEIINVSAHENNYALSDVDYKLLGETLKVTGNLLSYERDAAVRVQLSLNDSSDVQEQNIWVDKLQPVPFEFECEVIDLKYLRVAIANKDALGLDNEVVLYNPEYEKSFRALIVSDTEFFLDSVMSAIPSAQITKKAIKDYADDEGYDLYIFESYTPQIMPRNGAVWFINPVNNNSDAGFVLQGERELNEGGGSFKYSTSSNTAVKKLEQNLLMSDIYVNKFTLCSIPLNFTTLLSYGEMPVLFTGTNSYGNREVVFAFDLKHSNLALLADYVTLITNLVEYTFPDVVGVSSLGCGEMLDVNIVSGCESVRVQSPSGKESYLNIGTTLTSFALTEVGTYKIIANIGGVQRVYSVYSLFPEDELSQGVSEESFIISGEASNEKSDGTFSQIWFWFIIIGLLAAADWMVYCYEQYQLR